MKILFCWNCHPLWFIKCKFFKFFWTVRFNGRLMSSRNWFIHLRNNSMMPCILNYVIKAPNNDVKHGSFTSLKYITWIILSQSTYLLQITTRNHKNMYHRVGNHHWFFSPSWKYFLSSVAIVGTEVMNELAKNCIIYALYWLILSQSDCQAWLSYSILFFKTIIYSQTRHYSGLFAWGYGLLVQ